MTKSGGDDSSGNASTASLDVRHVGQYQLLDPLGRGGMGVVYKAVHTRLKRFAAIKFIRPDLALHETVLRRFFREIELLGQCDHPNVLRACGGLEQACPVEHFYPVHWRDTKELLAPWRPIPQNCYTVHAWRTMWRYLDLDVAGTFPATSVLGQFQRRLADRLPNQW